MSLHRGSNERFNKKRTRSDNWTNREKELLLSIIPNFQIVEAKSCVDTTLKRKAQAWQDISNELARNNVVRQPSRIKEMWHRMKGTAKANILNYRLVRAHMGVVDDPATFSGEINGKPTEMDWTIAKIFPHEFINESEETKAANIQGFQLKLGEISGGTAPPIIPVQPASNILQTKKQSDMYNLQWNNFSNAFSTGFNSLLENSDLVDVTIAMEGHFIQAHKLVLSVCSDYFRDLFKANPCQHPIVILKDVEFTSFKAILQFMYTGEVQLAADKLSMFMNIGSLLKVKGLQWDANQSYEEKTKNSPEPPMTRQILIINQNSASNKRKQEPPVNLALETKFPRLTSHEPCNRKTQNVDHNPPPLKQKPIKIINTETLQQSTSNRTAVGSLFNLIVPSGMVSMAGSSKQQVKKVKECDNRNYDQIDSFDIKEENIKIKVEHISDDDDNISVMSNLEPAPDELDRVKEEMNQSD